MASYNEDPIDRALSYWDDGDAWSQYKERFLKKTKGERVEALIKADEYLAGDLKPTHETASLWTKRRELDFLHRKLDSMGR
jgi:hypothetical protein